ncbi:daptide biosynthesis intramembrane metalloprotease [Microbacterium sp. APC 3901]|uniref:daptide biosynthesis intramembrane metalloprotease n=1 Tax=Microbacterium sp. APC 3901 TaxID=3035192 RepID=UPI0025B45531|nr:daptide biosynthesis intramembrane metalloprotease [Microbacterium sp. APC 3901]MDN3442904.1 M50 family metallopeptidase [Microbacterium sp. APC 3901]
MPPGSFPRRHRPRSGEDALAADSCPLLASGVDFEQADDDGTWIATLHGVPSSRVSRTVVELLRAMNGETALHDLHRRFAPSESWEHFLRLAGRFRACGLLEGDEKLPPGRVVYRPPFTLQIATLRAPAIFGRLDRLIVPLPHRAVVMSIAILLCLGLVAATAQTEELWAALTTPVPLIVLAYLVVTLSLMTLLHESAHGITLTRFGGRPRRAGFMLFYLSPAFFVDVTDGWRLPERRQRVAIALAGPAVHAVVGAIALIVALTLSQPVIRQSALLLAVSCGAIALINLIPFVRFDGYIALMSALDEPNLRARAIHDASGRLAGLLFGGQRSTKRLDTWWSVPFGLACLVTPVVLVVFAVARIARALAGGGPILGSLVMALEAVVVIAGVVILVKALRRVLRSGVPRLRFGSVVIALVASIVIAGAVIPVPVTATFGFTAHGDRVVLLQAGETGDASEADVPEGARVVLMSNGILADEQVGEGVVWSQRPHRTRVPLEALFPIVADGVTVPAVIIAGVNVSEETGSLPATGQARVELGVRSLWQTLWVAGVEMPLSSLQSGEVGKE